MKITILTLLFCLLCPIFLFAQSAYTIKGSAADTASKLKLHNTSVVILNAKDSTLKAFTRAGTDGTFSISGLSKGKFILLMSYPGYADYTEMFSLDSVKRAHDFGRINMFLKSKLLADVIIKGTKAAIKIKGDTTEFNASSYVAQPNAKVEDLLKQLPGITVDKDGKITAQGVTVTKVLLDGEEFFGDDPTLVTKNIRQDMVDKVQLYDKKSDQATFTGIDDGMKTKTLDIKLKANKKSGSFGKADLGIGTKGFYQEQLAFNKFRNKEKISVYGTYSNTSKIGLGWQDSQKYGAGSNDVQMIDGGVLFLGGDDFDGGNFYGQGVPKAISGGLHYDNKWKGDTVALNTNYKFSSVDVQGTTNTQTQNNLPTGTINSNSDQRFDNNNFKQKLDATYQLKIDSSTNLKISVDGTGKTIDTKSDYEYTSVRGNDVLLNHQARTTTNKGDQKIFNATEFFTQKLKKKGRTLSVSLTQSLNQSNTHGLLNSDIQYYNAAGVQDSTAKIDQLKRNDIKSAVLNSNATYTEPLSKVFSLVLNYGLIYNSSTSDRRSYNASGNGQYDNLDLSLSSDYKLNQLLNLGGAVFNYNKKKTIFNFGTKVSDVNFHQVDQLTGNSFRRSFLNWMPQATYQYKFSQQSSVRLSYNGNTTQPTIDQIQPLKVNTDPLNITLGNPNLKPSFRNSFNGYYNSYKVLSDEYLFINGSYSFTSNAIVNNTVTDSAGKNTYQYINLSNRKPMNFYVNTSYGRKIFWGLSTGIQLNMNGNKSYNYINNIENASKSITYSGGLSLNKNKAKKYDFYVMAGPSYTVSGTSIQSQINNNGRGFTVYSYENIYLPGKIQISVDGSYQYTAATQSFSTDFKRTLINASLTKSFLKTEALKMSIRGNDILNQNTGFNRSAVGNQITQTTNTTIKRYFMFSIVYDFSHMGGGAPKK